VNNLVIVWGRKQIFVLFNQEWSFLRIFDDNLMKVKKIQKQIKSLKNYADFSKFSKN